MITFSFRPISGSILPLIAASVRTFFVSWKDAADRKEFVARDALVKTASEEPEDTEEISVEEEKTETATEEETIAVEETAEETAPVEE